MRRAWLCLLLVGGCHDPVSSMGDQPKRTAYSGSSARQMAAGTVAGGEVPGWPYAMGASAATRPAMSRALVDRGQVVYGIYCVACHGALGDGRGHVVQYGLTPPPSFHAARLRGEGDEKMAEVVEKGYGAMFPLGDRVGAGDRWAVVAYVRALQASVEMAKKSGGAR